MNTLDDISVAKLPLPTRLAAVTDVSNQVIKGGESVLEEIKSLMKADIESKRSLAEGVLKKNGTSDRDASKSRSV
jgi:hypothetical protein